MNKKISLGLCLSLVIITVAATFAITMVFSKQIYNSIISNISQRSQSYETAEEINEIIVNNYYGSLDDYNNGLSAAIGEGYINSLNDANSLYMTSSEYADYSSRLETGVTGIGIETAYDYSDDQLVVTYVYAGSSAETEGLQKGDVITAVGNVTVTRSNFESLQALFTANRMGSVQIEYLRDSVTKVVQPISSFTIPTVITENINGTGYIRISSFYKNTAEEFRTAVNAFRDEGVTSIVVDVRNTSEGTIDYAAKTLDTVLSNSVGNIATLNYKDGKTGSEPTTADNVSNGITFAVLINSGTKGPAELFACDMRDLKQAQLVGTTTAGVGTMQELYTLDDGSAILLTTALVVPNKGEDAVYDGTGIEPTDKITLDVDDSNILLLSHSEDRQLQEAIAVLPQQQ